MSFFFCAPPGTFSKYVCILATLAFTLKCPLMLPEIVEKIVTARVVARDEFNWWVEIHLDYLEEKEKKCTIICQLESDEKGRHRAESQMDVGETDWISKV